MSALKQKISLVLAVSFLVVLSALGVVIIINLISDFPIMANNPLVKPFVKKGLVIISPQANEKISSPLKIKGYANGNGWVGFEGQVGLVELEDSDGNILAAEVLTATTDWTNPPVNFETTLNFNLDKETNGKLVFSNENPSGLESNDRTFELPIKISKTGQETVKVKAYFSNNNLDPEISCNKVFAVEREIPKTEAVARAALEELLKGPAETDKSQGYFTNINPGVQIQKLTIENGVAKADFDEQLEYQVGGSCRVSAIRAQITQTLKQFSTVKSVVISINNRTEDILQP